MPEGSHDFICDQPCVDVLDNFLFPRQAAEIQKELNAANLASGGNVMESDMVKCQKPQMEMDPEIHLRSTKYLRYHSDNQRCGPVQMTAIEQPFGTDNES